MKWLGILDLLPESYVDYIWNRHGENVVRRAASLLEEDISNGRDLSSPDKAVSAMNAKLKYVQLVDESARRREVRRRSFWLLLRESGEPFKIGDVRASISGDILFIDGSPVPRTKSLEGWLYKQFLLSGFRIEPCTDKGREDLDRFPILKGGGNGR